MRGRRRRRRTYESPVEGRVNFADERSPSLHQLFEERLYFVLSGDVVRKRCCCWTGPALREMSSSNDDLRKVRGRTRSLAEDYFVILK